MYIEKCYYAALLPRRGPHIASHSVCPSVCPSVPLSLPSVMWRHLANYNDTHVRAAYRTAISAAQILVLNKLKVMKKMITMHSRIFKITLFHNYSTYVSSIIMRPFSLGGGRILRRTLSVCLSVCPSVRTCTFRQRAAYRTAISAAQILVY